MMGAFPPPMSAERCFTIGELSQLYNVSLRTLRFYESKGLLNPKHHGDSRLYSSRDRVRLEAVLTGRRLGFSLQEIGQLFDGQAEVSPALSREKIERRIATLED